MHSELKRTWAEIDLDCLEYNYRKLKERIGENCKFLGVVKADAYGHGAVQVAKCLEELGADYLAVSSLDEAMELRSKGIAMPILVLGHTPADQVKNLIMYHVTQAVSCESKALEYEAEAAKLGERLKVHIKLDTGMSRLGFLCEGRHFDGGVEAVCRAVSLPHLDAEGIFTHFAVSDSVEERDIAYTRRQFTLFMRVIEAVEARGFSFKIRHCANTGGVANYPETYLDMVRPGLLLYGYGEEAKSLGLRPVMTLKSTVSTIKVYDEDTLISYGGTWQTEKKTRMGVLPIGYADGLFRCLSNHYSVMTAEGAAPIRGRICMDMCMIDLSEKLGVDVGDEVVIFGSGNPIEAMADVAGTIPYELVCAVSKRVPRVFYRNGEICEQELRILR